MVVCICAGVTERKLRAVIAAGATTAKAVERQCGAGAGCGACRPFVRDCLRECQAAMAQASSALTIAEAAELAPA